MDVISRIVGITLHSLKKYIAFDDKWDENVNREICRIDYYQRVRVMKNFTQIIYMSGSS